ncbi:MAG: hypothetical protein J6W60_13510 [Treponema sp.]|nr:hypothetical protein [Treponema sp.]
MKLKKTLLIALLMMLVPFVFADDPFMDIATNAKTTTTVYLPSKDKTYSLEEAIQCAMVNAWMRGDADYDIKFYKDKSELFKSSDFKDEYIYGSATMAVVNLHYGIVEINYSRYSDEVENIVGWDYLSFFALDDGRVMCIKILEGDRRLE